MDFENSYYQKQSENLPLEGIVFLRLFQEEFPRPIWRAPQGTIGQPKLSVRPNEDITSFV